MCVEHKYERLSPSILEIARPISFVHLLDQRDVIFEKNDRQTHQAPEGL